MRLVDAFSGWKAGRDYLEGYENGGLPGLAADVSAVLRHGVGAKPIDGTSESMRTVARRHCLSALQRMSAVSEDCATRLAGEAGLIELVAQLVSVGCLRPAPGDRARADTGTVRFASALLLNLVVGLAHLKAKGGGGGGGLSLYDDASSLRDVCGALCRIMEEDAPLGREAEADRWGRRYAAAAMYAFVADPQVRKACTDTSRGKRPFARAKPMYLCGG